VGIEDFFATMGDVFACSFLLRRFGPISIKWARVFFVIEVLSSL
jgi:hypothetical protein